MINVNVPNGSTECTKLEREDRNILKIIEGVVKGYRQVDIAFMLSTHGCIFYEDLITYSHKRFDAYITRVQKKFRDLNINAHIYYGMIGANQEFGYYLQVAT
jgi:hypothetical protein